MILPRNWFAISMLLIHVDGLTPTKNNTGCLEKKMALVYAH